MLVCVLLVGVVWAGDKLTDWDKYRIIWQDEFDFFDMNKWDHEITAWGGGVSYQYDRVSKLDGDKTLNK